MKHGGGACTWDDPFVLVAQSDDTDSISVDCDVVFVLLEEETSNLWFPKLEAEMLEDGWLIGWSNISHLYSIGIHVYSLIPNQQFLISFLLVLYNSDISVSNVKLIIIFEEELELQWVQLIELNEIKAQFAQVLIDKDVK